MVNLSSGARTARSGWLAGLGRVHVGSFSRGSFFGGLSFLDHLPKDADAVARSQAELYLLSRESVNQLSRDYPEAGAMLFARVAKELAHAQRRSDAMLRVLGS